MTKGIKPTPSTGVKELIQRLAKVYGDQIVRRDNKFYDIDGLGVPLCRAAFPRAK